MNRGSDQWRHHYWESPCEPTFSTVTLGRARLRVDQRITEAVQALEAVLVNRHGYDVHPAYPEGDTGSYNCRHIGNDSSRPWSSHAWATAIDVNWNSNPDGSRLRTDIPPGAIRDIHRIRTKSGAPVWRWGGDWDRDPRTGHSYYDAMHFEIHATPEELATGIVLPDGTDTDPVPHITVRRGDRGATVAHLQEHIEGLTADGIFGPSTEEAVVAFQRRAGLTDDGVVGEKTWRALHKEDDMPLTDEDLEKIEKRFRDVLAKEEPKIVRSAVKKVMNLWPGTSGLTLQKSETGTVVAGHAVWISSEDAEMDYWWTDPDGENKVEGDETLVFSPRGKRAFAVEPPSKKVTLLHIHVTDGGPVTIQVFSRAHGGRQ